MASSRRASAPLLAIARAASALTALVVLTFLGMLACGLGSPTRDRMSTLMAMLGIAAFILAALAIATGSLTALSLLVADIVLLWAGSTLRHMLHMPKKPLAA